MKVKWSGMIIAGLIIAAGLYVTGCGSSGGNTAATARLQAKNPEVIRIGYVPGVQILFTIAKEQGWFEEEFKNDNVKFEYRSFLSGPPLIEAMAAEQLDIGQVGDQPAIQAKTNNIDIKAIGAYAGGYRSLGLVVAEDSNIHSVSEMKNKKVGVSIGTLAHQLLLMLLEANGLTSNDIQMINLSPADIKVALESKHIDAAVLWEPWIAVVEEAHAGHKITDGANLKPNTGLIIARSKFANEHPDTTKRILKVFIKAQKWLEDPRNTPKAIELVSRDTKIKPDIVAAFFPNFEYNVKITPELIQEVQATQKYLKDNNIIRREIDIKELLDSSFWPE